MGVDDLFPPLRANDLQHLTVYWRLWTSVGTIGWLPKWDLSCSSFCAEEREVQSHRAQAVPPDVPSGIRQPVRRVKPALSSPCACFLNGCSKVASTGVVPFENVRATFRITSSLPLFMYTFVIVEMCDFTQGFVDVAILCFLFSLQYITSGYRNILGKITCLATRPTGTIMLDRASSAMY